MEVVIPVEKMDNYGECYFSAPTSPTRLSDFYREFNDFLIRDSIKTGGGGGGGGCAPAVPFCWEEKPGVTKLTSKMRDYEEDDAVDFAFDVSQELDTLSLSAEELFDGGIIKPLTPPPRLQLSHREFGNSSPKSLSFRAGGLFSPKKKSKEPKFDPSVASVTKKADKKEGQRGREMARSPSNSSRTGGHHPRTRSLSPSRVSKYPWEEEQDEQLQQPSIKPENSTTNANTTTNLSTTLATSSSSKGFMKWRLRDLFLFRSASEGRSTDRDPSKKYAALFRKHEEFRNSSDSPGSGSKRRGRVSAHELHYTVNRAVSEDLKKKTFLPYKQGILGRLAFNPTVNSQANGFGYPNYR